MIPQQSREDYLEAILLIKRRKGFARAIDVANFLAYSRPSVSLALGNLKKANLVTVGADGGIDFTPEGGALAERVYARHEGLRKLLSGVGVTAEIAEADACRIEHVISQESFEKLIAHADLMRAEDGQ